MRFIFSQKLSKTSPPTEGEKQLITYFKWSDCLKQQVRTHTDKKTTGVVRNLPSKWNSRDASDDVPSALQVTPVGAAVGLPMQLLCGERGALDILLKLLTNILFTIQID